MFVYLMAFWSILGPIRIFYGHLVYFLIIWYIFPRFGILYQGKSGNPGSDRPSLDFPEEFCLLTESNLLDRVTNQKGLHSD
jgi:hypothetical protein